MKSYDENNFREIEWYEGLSVIRFFAPWCQPCVINTAVFEEFSAWLPEGIKTGIVNIDLSPVLTQRYGIWGLPSVIFIYYGKVIQRVAGVKSLSEYQEAFLTAESGRFSVA